MFRAIHIFILMFFSMHFTYAQKKYSSYNYQLSIPNRSMFDELKGEPLTNLYSGIECVKLCYNIQEKKIYFINSTKYRFHIDFSVDFFNDAYNIVEYNNTNYTINKNRKYVLGCLNYYQSQKKYVLEFVSEDNVPIDQLNAMYIKLKDSVKLNEPIYLLINNSFLMNKKNEIKNIPIINPEELFNAQTYQPLVIGTAYGYARSIANLKTQFNTVKYNDIIFFTGSQLALPHCAAVITNSLQTPLSHINILCNNRQTPACAITNWDSVLKAKNILNQPIELKILNDKYEIKAISEQELNTIKQKKYSKINLTGDVVTKDLQLFKQTKNISKKCIGGKAFGVYTLYNIQKNNSNLFDVPKGAFAIPYYYYKEHFMQKNIYTEYLKLLKIPINNLDSIQQQLKILQKAIKKTPINKKLLEMVTTQITKNNPNASYRFRSSSNAEDNDGFSGAGLYDSYTGILNDTNKSIEKAIKKVWASVWNFKAYQERNMFNINNANVLMAVLVHQGFPNEEANGVAITKNLFRADYPGFTINVQKGEVSVVSPSDSTVCDQLICFSSKNFTDKADDVYEQYISKSNINNGANVLTHQQVVKLYYALEAIKNYYYFKNSNFSKYTYEDFSLDIEFKFYEDKLFIKQVRPFK